MLFHSTKTPERFTHSFTGNSPIPFSQLRTIPAQGHIIVAASPLWWSMKGVSSPFLSQELPGIYVVFMQVSVGQTPWRESHEKDVTFCFSPSYQPHLPNLPPAEPRSVPQAKGLRIHILVPAVCHPASFRMGIQAMEDLGQLCFLPLSRPLKVYWRSAAQLEHFKFS